MAYQMNYLRKEIGEKLDLDQMELVPILRQLRSVQSMPDSADEMIRATLCTPEVAEALECDVGTPLLDVFRVYKIRSVPVMVLRSQYRSDRYAYNVHLLPENAFGTGV